MSGEIAYVPGFANDIFISYPHQANVSHWVTELKEDLQNRLTEARADAGKVWLSQSEHERTGTFVDDIDTAVTQSAVLLTISSDPYKRSAWCIKEKEKFEQKWGEDPRTKRGHRRIVEVIQSLPPNKTAGTHWYDSDPCWFCGNPKYREPESTFRRGASEYTRALDRLFARVRDTLDALRDETIPVFLNLPSARPGDFCARYYEKLRKDIGRRYALLAPGTDDDDLAKARVSIHLLGKEYDPQTNAKIELLKTGNYPCVVVIDPELQRMPGHPVERLVRRLDREQAEHGNLVIYRMNAGGYEDFLSYIESLVPPPTPAESSGTRVSS